MRRLSTPRANFLDSTDHIILRSYSAWVCANPNEFPEAKLECPIVVVCRLWSAREENVCTFEAFIGPSLSTQPKQINRANFFQHSVCVRESLSLSISRALFVYMYTINILSSSRRIDPFDGAERGPARVKFASHLFHAAQAQRDGWMEALRRPTGAAP